MGPGRRVCASPRCGAHRADAGVVEQADTQDLGSCAARRRGSTPLARTMAGRVHEMHSAAVIAGVAQLADAGALKALAARHAGSTPATRTRWLSERRCMLACNRPSEARLLTSERSRPPPPRRTHLDQARTLRLRRRRRSRGSRPGLPDGMISTRGQAQERSHQSAGRLPRAEGKRQECLTDGSSRFLERLVSESVSYHRQRQPLVESLGPI